jgi:hypothetical protein
VKKTKTLARRLTLNKETLRSLDERESRQVPGGNQSQETFCVQCYPDRSGGYESCIECH